MKENNIQLINGEDLLYPLTKSDNVILRGFEPLAKKIGLLELGEDINGITLTDFINAAFLNNRKTFRFLHLADTHTSNNAIKAADELLKSDPSLRCAVITGDLQLTSDMKATIAGNDKIYVMLGNHDTADDFHNNQKAARDGYIAPYMETRAVMGDDAKIGSWWYKDIENVRFISFDEYEQIGSGYGVRYTKKQIKWFLDLLQNTPSSMYIVLLHHQPRGVNRDIGNTGLFTSEKAPSFYEFENKNEDAANIIPDIMEAYLSRGSINKKYNCGEMIGIGLDFSKSVPAKFVCHLAGHTHWDVCEYLPKYPKQLQLVVDQGNGGKYKYSDLPRSIGYVLNEYTIDFISQTIHIKRHGAHITDGGQDRNEITFSFKR